jgi:hypothetical protein
LEVANEQNRRLSTAGTIRWILTAAIVAVLVPIGPAQANALLATALGHTSIAQPPVCLATNIGTTPVLVNSIKLFRFDGSQVAEADGGNCDFRARFFAG